MLINYPYEFTTSPIYATRVVCILSPHYPKHTVKTASLLKNIGDQMATARKFAPVRRLVRSCSTARLNQVRCLAQSKNISAFAISQSLLSSIRGAYFAGILLVLVYKHTQASTLCGNGLAYLCAFYTKITQCDGGES